MFDFRCLKTATQPTDIIVIEDLCKEGKIYYFRREILTKLKK